MNAPAQMPEDDVILRNFHGVDEAGLVALGADLAICVQPGDCLALYGDLAAGKSTLARALIRACLGDATLEVPSPTFALMLPYGDETGGIAHLDLYRARDAPALADVDFDDIFARHIALVEWPQYMPCEPPDGHLSVTLDGDPGRPFRNICLSCRPHAAHGWRMRLDELWPDAPHGP